MKRHETLKLTTFFSLYIAQSIPMSFLSTVIPVLMRQQEFSLTAIGLLQLIKVPWLIKFLWSPMVDRHTNSLASYKKWIIGSELCYAVIILLVSLLNLQTDIVLIAILIIASFVASATQDIATDSLAARSVNKDNKSLVNSMQSMGSFAGTMIGSGVLLLLYKKFGWNMILPALSAFVLIALIPLVFLKKNDLPQEEKRTKATGWDFIHFFTRKEIWNQIGFLFLAYSGIIGILSMLRPLMVDLGFSIQQIGFMSGVFGTSFGFCCSYLGGRIIKRIGRYKSRILFAAWVAFAAAYFFFISKGEIVTWQLYVGVALVWGGYGMSTVGVYTTSMDRVREGREGTDFTIQTVITHLSSMLIAIGSGKFAQSFGYNNLFCLELILALLTVTYAIFAFRNKQHKDE
ncbi:MAG: MFS transporter [Bacteroidales bacterium]